MREIIGFLRRLDRKFPARPLRGILAPIYYRYLALRRQDKIAATVDRITYELDLRELIDSTLYYEGAWEPDTVAALRRLIKPGQTVLDIGANMGCHTLLMAQLMGETGQVVAFEPMSAAYAKLTRNIQLNRFPNIVAEKTGLSNNDGETEIAFATSWRLDLKSDVAGAERVSFMTLDGYVAAHPGLFNRLDCIKLDVDGFEEAVLRGAQDTLLRYRPVVLMEIGSDSMGAVCYLQSQGYSFLTESGAEILPDNISVPETPGRRPTVNVVAIPPRSEVARGRSE
jgi:FkbM family methyltransferase